MEGVTIRILEGDLREKVSMLGTANTDSRGSDHMFFIAHYSSVLSINGLFLICYSECRCVRILPPHEHPKLYAFSSDPTAT